MAAAAVVVEVEVELQAMEHSSARSKTKPGRRHKGEPECRLSLTGKLQLCLDISQSPRR